MSLYLAPSSHTENAEMKKQLQAGRLILILIGALAASSTCYCRQPANINVGLTVLQNVFTPFNRNSCGLITSSPPPSSANKLHEQQ